MIQRRHTRPVRVGRVVIGGGAPIAIQSMTTTTPADLPGSLAQISALWAAGCQIVRLAVPSLEAARALGILRMAMREGGLDVPLAADVHFNPRAAYEAARHVEKVRINPGNFAPSPEEGRRRLLPLLDLLRERGAALRVGVNHGSLAPHISAAYGHGPRGMVASALEYLRFCRDAGFEQLVVALKASNPAVMLAANRLLAESLRAEQMDYPIHLGVTEAGASEEGVLRSALGIGALLLEGIGDTIRVSLTGDPVPEIEACRRILRAVEDEGGVGSVAGPPAGAAESACAGTAGTAPAAAEVRWGELAVGGSQPPRVELALDLAPRERTELDAGDGCRAAQAVPGRAAARPHDGAEWPLAHRVESLLVRGMGSLLVRGADRDAVATDGSDDSAAPAPPIWLAVTPVALAAVPGEALASVTGLHILAAMREPAPKALTADLADLARRRPGLLLRWELALPEGAAPATDLDAVRAGAVARARRLSDATRAAGLASPGFVLGGDGPGRPGLARALAHAFACVHDPQPGAQPERAARPVLGAWLPADPVRASVALGPLLLDGLLDVVIAGDDGPGLRGAYDLLQVARRRMVRADFISCPGCGRLAYDIESALRRLKARCGHLAGVKIAVMGCAVNGPGEMADADVGYVGSAAGKVDVYAGRERVGRGLDAEQAEALLVELLKARGLWREPPRE